MLITIHLILGALIAYVSYKTGHAAGHADGHTAGRKWERLHGPEIDEGVRRANAKFWEDSV